MLLQFLIPQYEQTDEVIKPLLDSIAIQQNVSMDDIGAIICNDGSDTFLSEDFLKSYPYRIQYHKEPHRGVSATRNACLDYAKADYVMFCDADDMFFNACGLWIVFNEIKHNNGFDTLVSAFSQESRMPPNKEPNYIVRQMDSTFVHGKIHRRKFLVSNHIRWNDNLTIHEDSYFNCLCQKIANPDRAKYCPTPFYLWKWRDESVCRHDPKYILKTYNNMLDSNTALVNEFYDRGRTQDAMFYSVSMIYDAYFTMNKDQWLNQENQQYRMKTQKRFKEYYLKFKDSLTKIDQNIKAQIIMGIKNRMFTEGLLMESITFDDWIKHVENDL